MKTTTNTAAELTETEIDHCNVSVTRGIILQADGTWLAMTGTQSRTLKTRVGAWRWFAKVSPEVAERLERSAPGETVDPFTPKNWAVMVSLRGAATVECKDEAGNPLRLTEFDARRRARLFALDVSPYSSNPPHYYPQRVA